MYAVVLAFHNILRWVVLILALLVLIRSFSGWLQKRMWSDLDRKSGLFFGIALDLQLLLGLILYFGLSPFALKAFLDEGMAFVMGNGEFRFYAVEHFLMMGLAMILTHLGSILPKKTQDSMKKYRQATLLFSLAVILILLGIPWGRPLFPNL